MTGSRNLYNKIREAVREQHLTARDIALTLNPKATEHQIARIIRTVYGMARDHLLSKHVAGGWDLKSKYRYGLPPCQAMPDLCEIYGLVARPVDFRKARVHLMEGSHPDHGLKAVVGKG